MSELLIPEKFTIEKTWIGWSHPGRSMGDTIHKNVQWQDNA
jgi:hypothetical protein